jgi:proteasome lid subunit RPN8/RPN11
MEKITTDKKFKVKSAALPYQPKEQPEPAFKILNEISSACDERVGSTHKLYLKQEAMHQIARHIGWGQWTEFNQVEQGGILLGQVFRDSEANLIYGVAHLAIAGESARGSSAHLEMTHETWKEMLDSVDKALLKQPEQELQIIGWYHTHPNNLSVYMSDTDRATQSRLFTHDWQFAIVLNPHKSIWRAFFGGSAQECRGYMVIDEETADDTPPDFADEEPRGGLLKRGQGKLKARLAPRMPSLITLQLMNCLLLGLILLMESIIVGLLAFAFMRRR